MSKSFLEAFEEWKNDHSYLITEDIGWEYADEFECPGPTPGGSSLTIEDGKSNSKQEVLD